MKYVLTSILFLIVSFSTIAVSANHEVIVKDLTAEQKALINLEIAQMQKKNAAIPVPPPIPEPPAVEKVGAWVNLGANIGKGLAGAAKEVGVAVNDFAATRVGMLTMALIVWHMAGPQLLHVFGGAVFFIIMLPLWFYIYRRFCVLESIDHWVGEFKIPHKRITYRSPAGDKLWYMFLFLATIVGTTTLIMFSGS